MDATSRAAQETLARNATARRLSGWVHAIDGDEALTIRVDGRLVRVRCGRELRATLAQLRPETVVEIDAVGCEADLSMVECTAMRILNQPERPPFTAATRDAASPALRSRFRYLEFRDPTVRGWLAARHQLARA